MAVAIRISIDPSNLLTGWQGDGWSVVRQSIITQVPGDATGKPIVHLQLDAFEWVDITFVGIGNADDAIAKLRSYIQAAGSDLYAYGLFHRVDVDLLGLKVQRYRLLLLHSQVQLVGLPLIILAAAFAALVFLQYITTGKTPVLQDLQNVWGSAVTSVGSAVGNVGSSIASTYIWATVAAAGLVIALNSVAKSAGVKAPPKTGPSGSVGVKTGILNAKLSS
jgi:hypothetical protein